VNSALHSASTSVASSASSPPSAAAGLGADANAVGSKPPAPKPGAPKEGVPKPAGKEPVTPVAAAPPKPPAAPNPKMGAAGAGVGSSSFSSTACDHVKKQKAGRVRGGGRGATGVVSQTRATSKISRQVFFCLYPPLLGVDLMRGGNGNAISLVRARTGVSAGAGSLIFSLF
jgi:hypothetical protein